MELGLLWDWQATYDAFKRRRDAERAELELEKLEFRDNKKVKDKCLDSILVNPQLALAFIYIGWGSHTTSRVGYKKNS